MMNGQQPLSHSLMGGLGRASNPMQQAPQGGPPQMPQTSAPPSSAYEEAAGALPSMKRAAEVARQRYDEALAAQEYSAGMAWDDAILGLQAQHGATLGDTLGALNAGMARGRRAHQDRELKKAEAYYRMQQEDYEQAQKLAATFEAQQLRTQARASSAVGGKFVPSGMPGLLVNNVTGAQLDLRDEANKRFVMDFVAKHGDRYENDEAAAQAAFSLISTSGNRSQAPGATPPPVAQQGAVTPPPLPTGEQPLEAPGATFDIQGWPPEGKEAVRRLVERYRRAAEQNPSEQGLAALKQVTERELVKLGEKYGQGAMPPTTATAPTVGFPSRKDKAAEAGAKKSAEVAAETAGAAALAKARETGKAEGVRAAEKPEDIGRLDAAIADLTSFKNHVDGLSKHPGAEYAAGWKRKIPVAGADVLHVPETTGAGDFLTLLEQIKSGALMQTLSQIKALSATGASGFGSLTEKEADRIIARIVAIDPQRQSPAQIRRELATIAKDTDAAIAKLKRGYALKHGEEAPPTGSTLPQAPPRGGASKVVNGITYVKREDGKWYPK